MCISMLWNIDTYDTYMQIVTVSIICILSLIHGRWLRNQVEIVLFVILAKKGQFHLQNTHNPYGN